MKALKFSLLAILCFAQISLFSQVSYTANDQIATFDDHFRYGVNPGLYNGWNNADMNLANIAAGNLALNVEGAGVKTWRPSLPEVFVNDWGYNVRLNSFQHYQSLGMDNHTVFLQDPSAGKIDMTQYCSGITSKMFDNIYLDIWDGGANGTPYNENNHFAKYVYETVNVYKDHVKFWEIWNEPDLSSTAGDKIWNIANPESWWNADPDPCDLDNIRTPIYHYIRLLRIAYDVIHTVDPDAYVATGGLGIPSFLDALLRNTDNPTDGSVNGDYPLKGGAYFDCLSYHVYPHIAGGCYLYYDNLGQPVYQRHSDAGADCLKNAKNEFQTVLNNYGYNGSTYPAKLFIITETDVPRFNGPSGGIFFGNDEIHRNWMMKAFVTAQEIGLEQMHVYQLGEIWDPPVPFDWDLIRYMGLYKNLNNTAPYTQEFTDGGKAYKTIAEDLYGYDYNASLTLMLNFPAGVKGGAFTNDSGEHKFVLWAETLTDQSEVASANYSFPLSLNFTTVNKRAWDYSITNSETEIPYNNISLTGSPVIFVPGATIVPLTLVNFEAIKNGNENILKWETEAEENIQFFEVEKANDAKGWQSIGKVNGGNNAYELIDNQPYANTYYRLKIVEDDESFYYSKVINISQTSVFRLEHLYPSPVKNQLNISFFAPQSEELQLRVFDVFGKLVLENNVQLSAGSQIIELDLNPLTSGLYVIDIFNDHFAESRKIIKE